MVLQVLFRSNLYTITGGHMEPHDEQGTTQQEPTAMENRYEFAGYRFNEPREAWHWFHRADMGTLQSIADRLEIHGESIGDTVDLVTDAFFDWVLHIGR
ncbi:hypothetical protein CCP3SC1_760010 [Gammaproteobacteria bacterium]